MVNYFVKFDKKVVDEIKRDIELAPKTITIFAEKTIPALIEKTIQPLRTEPREPTLPFIWSYNPAIQKAKRAAYFATLPKGSRGGRYRRTHRLARGWKVQAGSLKEGWAVTVSNDTPYLEDVQGVKQLPSHMDSGWVVYDEYLLKAEQQSTDVLVDAWLGILDSKGSKFK